MNGQEFLIALKKIPKLKEIPVIIFSTSSNPLNIIMTKELGAQDFITKPHKFEHLLAVIRDVLGT